MLEVREPATGEVLGSLPVASAQDVRVAAASAAAAQPLWALVPPRARARYLERLARLVLDERDRLAEAIARESGIPRTEAVLAELLPSVSGLQALADDGPRALAPDRPGRPALRRATVVSSAVGTVGIVAGSASPWSEPALEVAASLLAGNGVVLAPAAGLVAERLRALLVRAQVPSELVGVVHGREAVAALAEACDAVVAAGPPARSKATMLVLGGAPVERTVGGALFAAFAGAGQSPAAVGRLVVLADHAAPLVAGIEAGARRLRLGDPLVAGTEVGPLRSRERAAEVQALLDDAVARGATLLCGGRVAMGAAGEGAWFAPAVLRGVPREARVLHEAVPGPVLAVVEAASEAEAIELARDATGAVSVWSGDREHGERVARTLRAEVAWVNQHGFSAPAAAVRLARHVRVGQIASRPLALRSARWLPYDPALVAASTAAARVLHGREAERFGALRAGAVPLARVAVRLARGR